MLKSIKQNHRTIVIQGRITFPAKGIASMINSAKIGAYTQCAVRTLHTVKYSNFMKSAQTDLFRKGSESNVLSFFHNAKDTAEISQEAKEMLENVPLESEDKKTTETKDKTAEWKEKLEQMRRDMNWLRDELKRAGEVAEGMGEAMKEMIKCLRIAMRIMSGHNVPEADHRYLMDKDTALYSKAIMMRKEIIDPEDLERLSEDEEENNESSEIGEIPTPSADTGAEVSGDSVNADVAVDIEA